MSFGELVIAKPCAILYRGYAYSVCASKFDVAKSNSTSVRNSRDLACPLFRPVSSAARQVTSKGLHCLPIIIPRKL